MKKKVILIFLLVWFLVPFVFMTDLYPFFRFGMFAEPIKPTQTTEMLQFWWKNAEGKSQLFQPQMIGLTENNFGYILRHYFYTDRIEQLFSQIHQNMLKKTKEKPIRWQLKQLRVSAHRTDTTILREWQ